jgi:hypothetical protein
MLSEKFFLILETLRSHGQPDGSTRVVSTSRHVPIKLRRERISPEGSARQSDAVRGHAPERDRPQLSA